MTDIRDQTADARPRSIDPATQDPRTGAPLRDTRVGVNTTNNIPVAKGGSTMPWILGAGAILIIGAIYFMSGTSTTVVPDASAPAITETAPAANDAAPATGMDPAAPATSTAPAASDTAPAASDTAPAATDTAPAATPAAPVPAAPAPAN